MLTVQNWCVNKLYWCRRVWGVFWYQFVEVACMAVGCEKKSAFLDILGIVLLSWMNWDLPALVHINDLGSSQLSVFLVSSSARDFLNIMSMCRFTDSLSIAREEHGHIFKLFYFCSSAAAAAAPSPPSLVLFLLLVQWLWLCRLLQQLAYRWISTLPVVHTAVSEH